ncbi:MAG: T9SS type A sorting domain-containing protein [Flavobacteriaceae bacterium]
MRITFMQLFLFLLLTGSVIQAQNYWKKSELSSTSRISNSYNNYQIFSLDLDLFKSKLEGVSLRSDKKVRRSVVMSFPNSSGKMEKFRVYETQVLASEIAVNYPNIKTYIGYGIDSPGTRIRFSVTPQGVQTMTSYMDEPAVFTVPIKKGNNTEYISYNRNARIGSMKKFECLTDSKHVPIKNISSFNRDANDQILRTFRIAISTIGEYTNFWDDGNSANGNAQEDALAQVVSTLNRCNEIFEVDMAITFQLVTGTEIIYPDADTDPYEPIDLSFTDSINEEIQTVMTQVVGEANHDIGHLFRYSPVFILGNAGCIGCVCQDGEKGSGYSTHTFEGNDGGPYMSDFFDINIVAHEIGHQLGANHTYSHVSEGTGVNVEPGSGTTIMGYAGITDENDVQDNSDAYFNYHSIRQILENIENSPNNCWTSTVITNNPPIADAGSDYTIPQGTAFVLRGSATDVDGGDILTYTWEQIDDGVSTNEDFGPTKTSGSLWRSRPPTISSNRYMPILSRILSGNLTEINPTVTVDNSSWETVSTVTRTLNYALTVRDRSEINGIGQFPQTSYDTMTVIVDGDSGPFKVTSPASTEIWYVEEARTITWDVAGTNGGIVNTPTVNIKLSVDGGFTFPYTLASGIPNDGSHNVTVPAIGEDTSQARIMIEANNNIFFAINNADLSIEEAEFALRASNQSMDVCSPNNVEYHLTYHTFLGFAGTTNFSVNGLPTGVSTSLSTTSASTDGTAITLTISGTENISPGNYPFTISGTSGTIMNHLDLTLNVFNETLVAPILTSPIDDAIDLLPNVTLTWSTDVNAENYLVEIATDTEFTNIVFSDNTQTNSYDASLSYNTQYFWRVTPTNQCTTGTTSLIHNFTVVNLTCNSYDATDLPHPVYDNINGGLFISTINVEPNFPITDVNVTFSANHSRANDLEIYLESPSGTIIDLNHAKEYIDGANYENTVFDQEATTSILDGSPPYAGVFMPVHDMSSVYGEMSGGEWKLIINDSFLFNGHEGEVTRFTLNLCVHGNILSNDEINGIGLSNVLVYPNPSEGNFNLSFDIHSTDEVLLELFDISGRIVKSKKFNYSVLRFSEQISFTGLSKGLYLLKIVNGSKISTKKLIIR